MVCLYEQEAKPKLVKMSARRLTSESKVRPEDFKKEGHEQPIAVDKGAMAVAGGITAGSILASVVVGAATGAVFGAAGAGVGAAVGVVAGGAIGLTAGVLLYLWRRRRNRRRHRL